MAAKSGARFLRAVRAGGIVAALLVIDVAAFGACDGAGDADNPADASVPNDATTGADVAVPDVAAVDASLDRTGPPPTYADMTDAAAWSTYNIAAVDPNASGFMGGAFDGRYVYLCPIRHPSSVYSGTVARYDTQGPFAAAPSWTTFDITQMNDTARGFTGMLFDGRYLYLVPRTAGLRNMHGLAVRYDTKAPFGSTSSWTIYDLTTLNPNANGFGGGVFDGRYVYYIPFFSKAGNSGLVARYDARGAFTSATSWKFFDVSKLDSRATAFSGGVFDGRHVYLVPFVNSEPRGLIPRYDTQADFETAAAWQLYDIATLNAGLKGFAGGMFDGRFVYLVPNHDSTDWTGLVPRYDTKAPFTTPSSWTWFDMTTLDPRARGFTRAGFDGRNVYFAPVFDGTAFSGLVVRYDSQSPFSAKTSWSTYDLRARDPSAVGFAGTVFDGRFMYMVPGLGSTVARFDAKSPPSPNGLPGSY